MNEKSTINILFIGLHIVVRQRFVVSFVVVLTVNIVPLRKATELPKIVILL